MRKRIWQIHSWLGLVAGLGLLVIGVTGSLLIFHEEFESFFNPELVRVAPTPEGRLPMDDLLRSANAAIPAHEVGGWVIQRERTDFADTLYVIERGTTEWKIATIDPYSGRILATPRAGTDTITGWLLDLHYTFFADHIGLVVVGLFGVLLCLLGVTGVWIYREFWKHILTFRWRRGARLLFSDLHKFIGITTAAFNLLLGFTGAYWNLTHIVGHWIHGEDEPPPLEQRLYADTISLDDLMARASAEVPGYQTNYIYLPTVADAGFMLYGTTTPDHVLAGPYGSTVEFDAQTGALKATNDLRHAGWWSRAVDAFTPLHFGTFGGLPVKVLWCLGGLAPGILATSGFTIWWLRRRRRKRDGKIVVVRQLQVRVPEAVARR